MSTSSIFFNNLTVIDFAVITHTGMVTGGSATLDLSVSGPIDPHESVVIDFSAGKKQIKALIDGATGFDHKCWVNTTDPNIVIESTPDLITVYHRLSDLKITAAPDCFAFVSDRPERDIEEFLNAELAPLVVSNIVLQADLDVPARATVPAVVFRYVHGLKFSSSYGCKNIAHGHKSYISVVTDGTATNEVVTLMLQAIAQELTDTVFADVNDLLPVKDGGGLTRTITYTTPERGFMEMQINQKLIILETQTTVEHLVEYVRARFYDQLKALGVVELMVSEGLCKGATVIM